MNKDNLRRQIRQITRQMTVQQKYEKSNIACQRLIETPEFQRANVIMAYLSLPNEIDTAQLILYAWQHRKNVAVPKVSWQQRHLIPVQIHSLDTGLSTEPGGLRNPISGLPVPIEDIDIVVTPGLAFDRDGNRLGRGGSYYDRFFEHKTLKAVKCGLAFNEQITESIDTSEHDKPVDMLITDKEVIYFNKS